MRSKTAAPHSGRAGQAKSRTGSTTPAPLFLPHERGLQGPLTRAQSQLRGPRDTTGEGVNEHHLPLRNNGPLCTLLHYASRCDQTTLPGLGKAPLTGRAVDQAEAMREDVR